MKKDHHQNIHGCRRRPYISYTLRDVIDIITAWMARVVTNSEPKTDSLIQEHHLRMRYGHRDSDILVQRPKRVANFFQLLKEENYILSAKINDYGDDWTFSV